MSKITFELCASEILRCKLPSSNPGQPHHILGSESSEFFRKVISGKNFFQAGSPMDMRLSLSFFSDSSSFSWEFERLLLNNRSWSSLHCSQNIFFCSMKRRNEGLRLPMHMCLCDLDIHTILSSLLS